jgi:hypothetical protein
MAATATLMYEATAVGPTQPADLEAAIAGLDLVFSAIEQSTGCTLLSDTTTLAGPVVTRTIVFDIHTAQFLASFPTGQEAVPFIGLYTQALSGAVDSFITEVPVVIA